MKAWGFIEMGYEAAVQLMLQLCSKDSPAVLRISLCAYVIRIHGTAARPGASDPENAESDEMGGKKDGRVMLWRPKTPNIKHGFAEATKGQSVLLLLLGDKGLVIAPLQHNMNM